MFLGSQMSHLRTLSTNLSALTLSEAEGLFVHFTRHLYMKKILLTLTWLIFACISSTAQDYLLYSNYRDNPSLLGGIGTGKAETYNCAMLIDELSLAGAQVTSIRFPVEKTATLEGCQVWLTRQLTVKSNQIQPDLFSATATVDGDWAEAVLDEPFTLPAEPFYAGLTFTVKTIQTDGDKAPLMLYAQKGRGGVWYQTSRTYRKFSDISDTYQASLPLVIKLGGEALKNHAAAFADMGEARVKAGDPITLDLQICNHGLQPVNHFDYSCEIASLQGSGHVDLTQPVPSKYYGQEAKAQIQLPAIDEPGTYPVALTVTRVNGEENGDAYPTLNGTLVVMSFVPVHRPLMEEYTGTWCGWCPRGFVALERMNEKYPDDFIALSYHNADPMEVLSSNNYPWFTDVLGAFPGFPSAVIDRYHVTDAYLGDSNVMQFGIEETWLKERALPAPCDIEVTAAFTNDDIIEVNAAARFAQDIVDATYELAYALVADDLHGDTSDWTQSNYYTGNNSWPDDMAAFIEGGSKVTGLHFNDVVVAVSAPNGKGETGSLPATLTTGERYEHTFMFNTSQVVNLSHQPVIQDRTKLRVVAIVIDTANKRIVNANRAKVSPFGHITHPSSLISSTVTYTDLTGRKVAPTAKGLVIKTERYHDGTVKSIKYPYPGTRASSPAKK